MAGDGGAGGNPLVARASESTPLWAGLPLAEDMQAEVDAVRAKSWIAGGLTTAGTALDAVSFAADPLGSLASMGVSWLMEHFQPLTNALNKLAGNPAEITAHAQTWMNVAGQLRTEAGKLATAVGEVATWGGTAGPAYRDWAGQLQRTFSSIGVGCDGMAAITQAAGALVTLVRQLVRQVIADAVGEVVSAIGTAWIPGYGQYKLIKMAVTVVGKYARKVRKFLSDLIESLGRLRGIGGRLGSMLDAIAKVLARFRGGVAGDAADAASDAAGATARAGGDAADAAGAAARAGDGAAADATGVAARTGGDAGENAAGAARSEPHCTTKGDPVDVVAGKVLMTQVDVALPGVLGLVVRRTHLSTYRVGKAFGENWASTLDTRLEVDGDRVRFVAEDGAVLVYPHQPAAGEDTFGTDAVRVGGPGAGAGGVVGVLPEFGARRVLTATADGFCVDGPGPGPVLHFARAPETADSARGGDGRILPLTTIIHRCGDRIDVVTDERGRPVELVHSGGYRVRVVWSRDRVVHLGLLAATSGAVETLARFGYTTDGRLAEVVNASDLPLRFEYDPAGRLTRWADRNGFWYSYHYDRQGRCVRSTGSGGFLAATFSYDPQTRVNTVTDALGHATVYEYNELCQVVREVDPAGGVTLQEWTHHHELLSRTDPSGAVTRYTYDDHGNVVAVVGPDGTTVTASHTADRRPVVVTGPDGGSVRHGYDERGNLATVTDALGAVVALGYDAAGHVATITDPLGAVSTVECDGAGLPVRITDPIGAAVTYERDAAGRVVRVTDPLGAATTMSYTSDGKLASRTGPDGARETWVYDPEGNLLAHTSPVGAVTRFEYAAFDTPIARVDPDGTRLAFGYDRQLQLTEVTNPQGLTWSYAYDPAGRLVSETDFNGRRLTYRHDPAGRLVATTNGLGQTVSLARDAVGRLVARHAPEGRTDFTYDPAGRLVRAVSPSADVGLAYDPVGRLLAETVDGRTITFAYDAAGRRTSRTTPTGAVANWTYDQRDAPVSVTTGGHTIGFAHDAVGLLVQRVLTTATGGQTLRYAHDATGRLTSQTLLAAVAGTAPAGPLNADGSTSTVPGTGEEPGVGGARVVAQRQYTYRADGYLLATGGIATGQRAIDLDQAGRITAVNAAGWSERYAYDSAGNVVSSTWHALNSGTTGGLGVADAHGERSYSGTLIRRAGRYRFEHDVQGRVVLRQRTQHSGKPLTWRYTWDSADRLTEVHTPDGTRWSYRYDPFGRRLAKYRHAPDGSVAEQVDFTWDGAQLAEQIHHRNGDSAGPMATTWDYQPGTFTPISQTERHWLATAPQSEIDQRFFTIVADTVGTPTHLTTPNGDVVWEVQQTIWGTQTTVARSGTVCPIRFPGQYHDSETGHYYNNQRYYDPAAARYLTQDPLGLFGGTNPHAYVPNPTSTIDPFGLEGCDPRSNPGTATGRNSGPQIGQGWLLGSEGNAGRIPRQIADRLRGRDFKNFRDFREAFWREVAADPDLARNFSPANMAGMRNGNAPHVLPSQRFGAGVTYVLHHMQPIQHGGGVYDMDNLLVVTPLYHSQILSPSFHYGNG